ncbi:PREDICTED: uncharacterized protein LOC101294433 [Fragaria vesca subsp. vesca]|uniref:uncharacterized protein LOC101294433 n=1 Tax=Fragaria vesca subsp. vesca TaxID=101020 RepID=UPI0002C32A5A|nr:PREDICTED: uncharacterized protein LOC101294433 [Fragaria vesca subsp. vesca]XP_011458059.1 PREDICTED: uncharacterized protein LOC101294433 [Fragaria vesca subsp. vesca]
MKGVHSSKAHSAEKPIPGCLGRMVNLFDMSTGVSRNKLLTDKPHHDGSSLSRSQSDVVTMLGSPFGDQIEDKVIVSELRRSSSNNKANGTPIKMLLDQEMSKEVETKKNPPNVVAKLMGLDAFPRQQPDAAVQRSNASNYSQCTNTRSSVPSGCWQHEDEFLDKRMQHEYHQCPEQNDYKDVYEVWQQPPKTSYGRNKSPQKGRYNGKINEKQMDLVRQKFMEAKRLATDERLRQSKEFEDALEVLSSNKDLFLKFLQEPNSLFSQHLYELQSLPPPTETKRITVLRPTKMVSNDNFVGSGNKSDKQTNKSSQVCQAVWESHHVYPATIADQKVDEYSPPPTRIVVLRPTPGKTEDSKAVVSSPTSSPRLQGENFYEKHVDDEVQESIEAEEEITQTTRDNSMGHQRNETLLSSVFSNGYTGDESSFHKSEIEYAAGILSDSEVMSPSPRHSWDYINRFGSPFSSSSFSRMSCSPESSVCREAKKRLSERWAMMALNGNSQEQRHARRSSSTLGEMLALSEVKKSTTSEDESSHKEQERRESVSCLISDSSKEELVYSASLVRSKSLPVSSAVFSNQVSIEGSDHGKIDVPKELNKAKSMKSSLKGKVSSLFFSRNKKSNKEKSEASQANKESQSSFSEQLNSLVRPSMISDDASQCSNDGGFEGCFSPALCGASGKDSPVVTNIEQRQGAAPWEAGLSLAKPVAPGNAGENQDQPSPISVLEPPFVEDDNTIQEFSRFLKPDHLGRNLKSNLIDKSPPIGSIARTLSWGESCAEPATPYGPYLVKSPSVSTSTEEEEQDWHAVVQTLLSAAGLDGELQCDSFFGKWHSLESPLDPSLRDKYANPNDKEPLHEAKRRKWRSSRKLVFDCVNAALVDITGYGSSDSSSVRIVSCSGAHDRFLEGDSLLLADRVWSRVKEWFLSDVRCVSEDGGDINSLVVERVVKKEVVGRGWPEQMRCEIDIVGKEIEGKLLQELVEEAVVDLTGRT